jgi:hypothetical protein
VFVIDVASALLTLRRLPSVSRASQRSWFALSGKPHQWTLVDAFRIRNILAFTFQSVFLSLIPFVLAFFSLPDSTVWQVSLLTIATATLGDVLLVLGGVYRLSRPQRAVLNAAVVSTVTAILGTMAAIELLAVFGIVRPASGVYFLGLVVLLGARPWW